jgi:hypothetical protein
MSASGDLRNPIFPVADLRRDATVSRTMSRNQTSAGRSAEQAF